MNSLLVAARAGHLDNVRTLILAGADINEKDEGRWTPLHYSSDLNHTDIVKALISAGANVNLKGRNGYTAMHCSAEDGHEDVVKALISAGADVNKKDNTGRTALHFSSCFGHTNIVKMLISAGADMNEKDEDGWTPLHYSAMEGHSDTMKALISAGADVNAKDKDGLTALHCSFIDWDYCNVDIVKTLISSGVDVNAKDEGGCTPLLCCVKMGHTDIIKALIFFGADACVVNKMGDSLFDLVNDPSEEVEVCIKYTLLYQERSNLKNVLERRNDVFFEIWNECNKQVVNMKETMLGCSCVSLFEFTTEIRENKLALYTSEENFGLKKYSERISYIERFPMYAEDIKAQFNKGSERANLLHKSQEFLRLCFCNTLPLELIRKICECMENSDMEKFLNVNNIL